MEHQDWTPTIFNSHQDLKNKLKRRENEIKTSKNSNMGDEYTLEAPKNLGSIITQARVAKGKNRKQLAADLKIAEIVLARWETNKETPTNLELSKLERLLATKLPRCKKVKKEKE